MKICEIVGHKYEARYDYGEPQKINIKNMFVDDIINIMESLKPKTYVHDICTRCGHIIKKS